MKMTDSNDAWPHKMLNTIYYSEANNFDRVYFVTDELPKWDQWSYTTTSGQEVLIAVNASGYGAKVMYSREDAILYVSIENYHVTEWSATDSEPQNAVFMTKEQLEQVVDQINFSLVVQQVNIELAKEKLSRFENIG